MNNLNQHITTILSKWDPIGVGYELAYSEYRGYASQLIPLLSDEKQLLKKLECILVEEMELEYDSNNKRHVLDLTKIVSELIKLRSD